MPPADRPSDRALWVAALINPCPSGASADTQRPVPFAATVSRVAPFRPRLHLPLRSKKTTRAVALANLKPFCSAIVILVRLVAWCRPRAKRPWG